MGVIASHSCSDCHGKVRRVAEGGVSPWDCPMNSAELQKYEVGWDCKLERVLGGGVRNQDSSPCSAFNCYVREV